MRKLSKLVALALLWPALAFGQASGPPPVFTNIQATNYGTPITATGADTVTFTAGSNYQQINLAAATNETITLVDARTPGSGTFDRDVLKVCQPSGGNDTETFSNAELVAAGTGWSNLTQRGYTLTASRCDTYCLDWNTTYHDCGFLANVSQ